MTSPTSDIVARLLNPTGDEKLDWECREEAAALISSLVAERDALREALTPSGDTKGAYMGEFSFGVTLSAGDEEEYRRIQVPWTTIKEIMAAISERATLSIGGGNG